MTRPLSPRIGIFIIVALALVGCAFLSGSGALLATIFVSMRRLDPSTICLAAACSGIGMMLSGVEWWKLIGQLGYTVSFRSALTTYLIAGLGGYVVNSVGPAIGSAVSLRRYGVSPGRAALLTVIANALGFCGILVWAPIGILLLTQTGMAGALPISGKSGPVAVALILIVAAIMMVLVLRALTTVAGSQRRVARRLLGSLPSAAYDWPVPLRTRRVLGLVPWSAGSWVAGVGALYVVLSAMNPGASLNLGAVVGSAMLAATLGSLAFFMPEGLGVSDGLLIVLLTHATDLPTSTCVAAAITVRALDPFTKLAMLAVAALAAQPAVTHIVRRWIPSTTLHDLAPDAAGASSRRSSTMPLLL